MNASGGIVGCQGGARGARRGARYAAASFVPTRVMLGGAGSRLGVVMSEVSGVGHMVLQLAFHRRGLRFLSFGR